MQEKDISKNQLASTKYYKTSLTENTFRANKAIEKETSNEK